MSICPSTKKVTGTPPVGKAAGTGAPDIPASLATKKETGEIDGKGPGVGGLDAAAKGTGNS